MTALSIDMVAASLSRHLPLYRRKSPTYQQAMLNGLLAIWQGHHARLLDIGGGTGVIAQCMQEHFPVSAVEAVDVVDRFCKNLDVATHCYDGIRLPFGDRSFDAATINNVVHHVPVAARVALLSDVRRVVRGPLYIKDHEARLAIDHIRLAALDFLGNVPFSGMVRADYLSMADWRALAAASGYQIEVIGRDRYRTGAFALLFPNRLEISMRWSPCGS